MHVTSLRFAPWLGLFTTAFAFALPSSARADEVAAPAAVVTPPPQPAADVPPATPRQDREDDKLRRVYLSISPVHLVFPVVEVTGEVRVHPNIGVAGIAGYGKLSSGGISFPVWEAGGQFVGYPVGHFDHGMQLGAEVLYVGASGETSSTTTKVSVTAEGLSTGAFVGYKLATHVGFSVNVQGGVSYIALQGRGTSSTGATAQAERSQWAPLLNANVGWSF
jgi:hypothetical protein